jgi:hypothetical protein
VFNIASSVFLLALQVTPPPAPPVLVTPAASPSPAASAIPSPASGNLIVSSTSLNLHPSQSQTISVSNAAGTIDARLDTPLVNVAVDQVSRTITVTATSQTGRALLTLSDANGTSTQIPVRVAFDAGTVPNTLQLRVTGYPLDPAWLQTQVQRAVAKSTQLQPGAVLQLGSFALPDPFAPGSTASVPVSATIAGGDQYFDVAATATVNVQNADAPSFVPALLFYDDDPEKISVNGMVYQNQISANRAARLYYYHQNANDPRRLLVVFRAMQGAASVHIIDVAAGPNADVMSVGHAVSRDFLSRKPRNEGLLVDISPGNPYVADEFLMGNLDGAAGSIGIRVLSGGPVQVSVIAAPVGMADAQAVAYADQPRVPGDGHRRTGMFLLDGNYGDEALAYTVGGPDASTQYGATTPPPADSSSGHDYGDYGVLRTLRFTISNPSQNPATVYLYERPMGGVVRGSFLVGDALVEVGCARLSERYQIGSPLSVPAGSSTVIVQTMTDGGSNYPLEVGMTATPPRATTPAISAPDGCFPRPSI